MKDMEKLRWRHDRFREARQENGQVHGNPRALMSAVVDKRSNRVSCFQQCIELDASEIVL